MNRIDSIENMISEIEGHMMSLDLDSLTLAEFHALPRLMLRINILQLDVAKHLNNLTNEVRKDCHNIEEAASNK